MQEKQFTNIFELMDSLQKYVKENGGQVLPRPFNDSLNIAFIVHKNGCVLMQFEISQEDFNKSLENSKDPAVNVIKKLVKEHEVNKEWMFYLAASIPGQTNH